MLEVYLLITLATGQPIAYATQKEACATFDGATTKLYQETIDHKGNVTLTEGTCEVIKQFREKK
jgi:hypothetical protein